MRRIIDIIINEILRKKLIIVIIIIDLIYIIFGLVLGGIKGDLTDYISNFLITKKIFTYILLYLPYALLIAIISIYTYDDMINKITCLVLLISIFLFAVIDNGLLLFVSKFDGMISFENSFYTSSCNIINTFTIALSAFIGIIFEKTNKKNNMKEGGMKMANTVYTCNNPKCSHYDIPTDFSGKCEYCETMKIEQNILEREERTTKAFDDEKEL